MKVHYNAFNNSAQPSHGTLVFYFLSELEDKWLARCAHLQCPAFHSALGRKGLAIGTRATSDE